MENCSVDGGREMKAKKWEISVALVSIILGILLAVQFQTQRSITEAVPTRRVEELAAMLKEARDMRLNSENKIKELKQQLSSGSGGWGQNETQKEMQQIKIWAGLENMIGQGVIITFNDHTEQSNMVNNNNLNVVQDEDLLRTVNELKAAGAEAISLNGQRIIANSEIRWAGSHILLNNTSLSTPYEIRAIGNAKHLEDALILKNGIVDTLSVWGIQIKIVKEEKVEVPAYKGNLTFKEIKIE